MPSPAEFLANALKRTARTLIKLANRLDGPTITTSSLTIPKSWTPEDGWFIAVTPPGGTVDLGGD